MPAKTVLWVDDEAELLEPHRLFLKEKGYDVQLATNADDAVELALVKIAALFPRIV